MKGHLYQITIEHLEAPKNGAINSDPLRFSARNHDDLFKVLARINERPLFDRADNTAFAVGLKLFSEVMLKHRNHELFEKLRPHFGEFMKTLKAR